MMNLLELHTHGDERVRAIRVGSGHIYHRREKFCARHGWIDMFLAGGKRDWSAAHGNCERANGIDAPFFPAARETPRALEGENA